MKRGIGILSVILSTFLMFSLCLPVFAAEAAENPVHNASFEEGAAGEVPAGYTKSGGGDVTIAVSADESRTGNQSLYISAADGKSAGARSTAFPITDNDCVYVAEMYAKGTGTVYIYLEGWVGSPNLSASASRVVAEFIGVTCTDTWQKVIVTAHIPQTADHITVLPYKQSFTAGAASVYCDDIYACKQSDYPLFLLDEIEKAAKNQDVDSVWSLMNTASSNGTPDLGLSGLSYTYKALYCEAIAEAGELTQSSLQELIKAVNEKQYQEESSGIFRVDDIKGTNESAFLVTENLVFPETIDGNAVTWTTDNPSVISARGEVARPAYGAEPVFVHITGALENGKSQTVGVLVAPIGMEENRMLEIANGDIEDAASGDVPGWSSYYGKVSYPQIGSHETTARTAFTGEKSLMLSTSAGISAPGYAPTGAVDRNDVRMRYAKVFTDTILNVYAGRTYTAGVMLKTPYDAEVTLKFYNIRTHECGSTTVLSSAADGWRYVPVTAMAPAGAIYARILVEALGAGDAYLDTVHMYERPMLPNADFIYGTDGWTEENGMLYSEPVPVLSDMEYALSAKAISAGSMAIEFLDAAGTVLYEETVSASLGEKAFVRAFAPSKTDKLRIKATAGAFSTLQLTPAPYGTQVPDGDFSAFLKGADTWKSTATVISETPFWSDSLEDVPEHADVWTTYNAQTAINYTNDKRNDGNTAMKIQVTGTNTNGGAVSPVFTGTAGETVSLQFKLLTETHGNVQVYLSTSTNGSSWNNTRLDTGNIGNSGAWQSFSFTTSATKAYNRILILFGVGGASEVPRTMYIDAVSIQKNGVEILKDTSFEKQWAASHSGGTVSYVTQDGKRYLQHAVSATSSINSGARSPMIPIMGSTAYTVKGKYIANQITIYIEFWSPDGNRISESHKVLPAASTWTEGSISATAPSGATGMTVLFYGRIGETLYVSDVSACEPRMAEAAVTPEGSGIRMQAGSISSGLVPVESGKKYVATVKTKAEEAGDVTMKLTYYSSSGRDLGASVTVASSTTEPELLKIGSTAPMYAFTAKIELATTKGAYFEQADMFAISNTLSNSSFENVTMAHYWDNGNFPMQWRTFGDVTAESMSNQECENRFGAMKLSVSGRNGGVRSSYIRAEGGKKYMSRVYAKGSGSMRLAFFDKDFVCVGIGEETGFASSDYEKFTTLATSPEATAYVTMELVSDGERAIFCDNAELTPGVLEIGDNTQMLIDDYVISETNLTRTFHQGKKTEPIFKGTEDYWENNGRYIYGTVLYDEEEKLYKMWYQSFNGDYTSGGDAASAMASYATSADGENWTKPDLGIISYPEYAGGEVNTNNNMIGNSHIMSVFIDREAAPEQRYKMITYGHQGYYIWRYSPDGIHWTDGGKVHDGADVINASKDSNGKIYGLVKYQPEILRRDFWTFVGDDVNSLETSVPANSVADVVDAKSVYHSDSYGMGFYDKDGVYIGFNWLYTLTGAAYSEGLIETNLVFSRDLKEEWQRPTREAMIPRGEEGSIDDGMIFTATSAIEMGEEVWMYCSGWDGDHGVSKRDCDLYIAKWRMDGFASLDGTGTLKTKPLLFDGSAFKLNANGAKGAIRVELQDENGNPIPGYTKADCNVITTDSVRHTVSWKGNSDVSALSGTPVTVCITAENSEIYSFAFGENDGVSVKMYQNGEKIDALVNGNVDVKIQTGSEFAGKTGVLMLAVYEGKELLRIVSADRKTYQGGEETTFPLTGLAIKENTTYTGKVFFWENFANAKPLRGATEYQLK